MEGDEEKSVNQQLQEAQQALKRCERQLQKSQAYNEELRQQIEVLSTELHGYRSGAQNRKEAECQVEEGDLTNAYAEKPFPDWGPAANVGLAQTTEDETGGGGSIADSLKAAAEEMVWKEAGFVYDNSSGLYYDYNSGYYYDSQRSLYYDPNTMAYFYYDEKEQTYKFHSYAAGQYNQQTSESGTCNSENAAGDTTAETAKKDPQTKGEKENSAKRKHHKHRAKEKAKGQKYKELKSGRRTKSSKKKHKKEKEKKEKKKKHKKKDKDVEDSDVIVVEGSDSEGAAKKKSEVKHEGDEMEVESSDSLATGESEMLSEPESGELSDQSSDDEENEKENDIEFCGEPVEYDPNMENGTEPEVSARYPPCVRVIVQESEVVDVGSFFLITCPGGTIGREKDPKHAIQIKDINISKIHAEIKYDHDNSCYTVEDRGSQNGTFINSLRISESKEMSAAVPLCHGDTLQVASTKMLLHIHPGSETCDDCEPGQVLAALRAQQTVVKEHVILTAAEKKKQLREQLKSIKKKYGLANSAYVDNMEAINNPDYADRAGLRQKFIGSSHESHKARHEAPASVHRPISTENKGHRMLAKMGWKEGSGLGKDSSGRAEPVTVEIRANQTAGLGSQASLGVSLDNVQSTEKTKRLLQTQARYQRLENSSSNNNTEESKQSSASTGESMQSNDIVGGNSNSSSATTPGKIQIKWVKSHTQKPP